MKYMINTSRFEGSVEIQAVTDGVTDYIHVDGADFYIPDGWSGDTYSGGTLTVNPAGYVEDVSTGEIWYNRAASNNQYPLTTKAVGEGFYETILGDGNSYFDTGYQMSDNSGTITRFKLIDTLEELTPIEGVQIASKWYHFIARTIPSGTNVWFGRVETVGKASLSNVDAAIHTHVNYYDNYIIDGEIAGYGGILGDGEVLPHTYTLFKIIRFNSDGSFDELVGNSANISKNYNIITEFDGTHHRSARAYYPFLDGSVSKMKCVITGEILEPIDGTFTLSNPTT